MSPLVTDTASTIPYASQRAVLDGRILALKEQIRLLSQELNELTPIGSLSSELLVEIFSYLQCEWWRGPNEQEMPFLVKITHVSHHWRAVALGCATLWTQIFFYDKTIVSEWLQRSRSASLCVSLDASHGNDALQLTLNHLHRIRHLVITIDRDAPYGGEHPQFPDVPAPVLSRMAIQCTGTRASAPLPYFARSFPSLSTLVIRACGHIDLTSPIFTGLTSLRVLECSISITLPTLLEVMRRMPGLKVLKLSTVSWSASDALPGILPPIKLPHLWKFEYSGNQAYLDFLFLSHLELSKKSSLTITLSTHISESRISLATSPTLTTMFQVVEQYWSGPIPMSRFEVHLDDDTLAFRTPHTHIRITSPKILVIHDRYMRWILGHISLFTKLLEITVRGQIDSRLWLILSAFRNLRSIKIESEQGVELFDIFSADKKQRVPPEAGGITKERKPRLVLSRLKRVILDGADFWEVSDGFTDPMRHRCNHDKKLPLLVLKNCVSISKDQLRELSDVVGEVDWDGVGEEHGDEESGDGESDTDENEDLWDSDIYADEATINCEVCGEAMPCDTCSS